MFRFSLFFLLLIPASVLTSLIIIAWRLYVEDKIYEHQ